LVATYFLAACFFSVLQRSSHIFSQEKGKISSGWVYAWHCAVDWCQGKLQSGLISLGKFDCVVDEVLVWLDKTNNSLDDAPPVFGNPKQIEMELAKLMVHTYTVINVFSVKFIISFGCSSVNGAFLSGVHCRNMASTSVCITASERHMLCIRNMHGQSASITGWTWVCVPLFSVGWDITCFVPPTILVVNECFLTTVKFF